MEISLADERALLLKEQLSLEQAQGRAWSKKLDAFGRMAKMGSFLQRPKDDDFELIYKEHRIEPFWHVECHAKYVYERRREFPLPVSGPEVEKITVDEQEYVVNNGRLILHGTEHCREEPHKEVFVDGYTNQPLPELATYLKFAANEVPTDYMDDLTTEKGIIVVPPQVRASAVVREVLIGMLRTVQADRILEDSVDIQKVDLYYRPVYAFQYRWKSREKEAILEYDGLTGQLQAGGKTFQQYMGKIMDPEFLFDVGADTIDLLVPGGGIAVKLARKGLDAARKK
jgi:transcriptional regulator of met regulon